MPVAIDTSTEAYGLPGNVIDAINLVFATYPAIEKAILYGSRAKGNCHPGSDIDLTIVGSGITERQILEIETRLDDLLLPYTIDLSIFHAINNPDLIDHINRVGVIFYADQR